MTDRQHPITPPPKLFKKWEDDILNDRENVDFVLDCAWRNGYYAGADAELEACANWLADPCAADMASLATDLRYSRRPKPSSLAEQALQELTKIEDNEATYLDSSVIRRALKRLQELESNG